MSGVFQADEVVFFEDEEDEEKTVLEQAFEETGPDDAIIVHQHFCRALKTDDFHDCDCKPIWDLRRGAKA